MNQNQSNLDKNATICTKKRSVKKEINSVKNLAGKDHPKFVEIYPKPEHVATKNTLPTSPHNKTKEIREF